MIKYDDDKYSLQQSDIEPIVEEIKLNNISILIPDDVLNYIKALIFAESKGGCIDDWECILADNIFLDIDVYTKLNRSELKELLKDLK